MYYTYYSYETDKGIDGLGYIGQRELKTAESPELEEYYGSTKSPKNKVFRENPNKGKIILGVFETREEALAHEIYLHKLWDVRSNPHFANQANQLSTGFSYTGPHSEQTKQKMSETRMGENNHFYGKTHTPETKQKLSESKRGENHPWYGKHLPQETRQKLSELNIGKKNPNYGKSASAETREKMSEAHKGENNHFYGKTHTPETKQKLSESKRGENHPNYGKSHSKETRQKMSDSQRDHTLYKWYNELIDTYETCTIKDLSEKYGLAKGHLSSVKNRKLKHHKRWTLID